MVSTLPLLTCHSLTPHLSHREGSGKWWWCNTRPHSPATGRGGWSWVMWSAQSCGSQATPDGSQVTIAGVESPHTLHNKSHSESILCTVHMYISSHTHPMLLPSATNDVTSSVLLNHPKLMWKISPHFPIYAMMWFEWIRSSICTSEISELEDACCRSLSRFSSLLMISFSLLFTILCISLSAFIVHVILLSSPC